MTSERSSSRHIVSRQRPVSCAFCRTRKLRCNRASPYSNCTSRGLPCQQGAVGSSEGSNCCQSSAHNAEILARLKRLEDIVLTDPRLQRHTNDERNQNFLVHPRSADRDSLSRQYKQTNMSMNADSQPQDLEIAQLEMVYITGSPKVSSPSTYLRR
jgi:Fungal Zn(2)-Cys(6) binuclear cluster domain.